jgi:hypothetical protein
LASGSKQAEQLLQKLEGLESAIQHRNRLLEYDRTRQVIKHAQLCSGAPVFDQGIPYEIIET